MALTRREFMHQAGLAAAAGLVTGCATRHLPPLTGVPCSTLHTFENWSHTIKFQPGRFCRPRTEQQLVGIVNAARADGLHVRTQGAGHSFSQLLPTPDTLLTLDDLERPIQTNGTRVTVPGGMRLKDVIPALRARGLAFRNLGSITEQSIAGAFSTGTHGSGLGFGAISTQVVGLRLVTGTGDVHTITEADARDLAAARINLGALGIITEVTLDCVPDYTLEYSAYLTRFDDVIGELERLNAENARVVLWWFVPPVGPRDVVVLITKNPVGARHAVVGQRADAGARVPSRRLAKGERGLRLAEQAPRRGFKLIRHVIEPYDSALTIPLLPVFHRECEYAVPVGKTVDALKAMRTVIEEGDVALDLPIEVRFVAHDDILLSPCNGQAVGYIGASTLLNSTEVFERFEPLMKSLGGRPHWGKNFTVTQEEFAQRMYPVGYPQFQEVRARFDPQRVFANSMLDELFP
jgi:FAD/FMN-containing dehydrogenase